MKMGSESIFKNAMFLVLVAIVAFGFLANADVVRPGDTGSILLPIENKNISTGSIEGVQIFANAAEPFNTDVIINSITCEVDGETMPMPVTISPGKSAMFTVRYEYKYNTFTPSPYQMPLIKVSGAFSNTNCIPEYIETNDIVLHIARSACLIGIEKSRYADEKYLTGPLTFSVPSLGSEGGVTVIAEADTGNGFFEVGRANSAPYQIAWDTSSYPEGTKIKVRCKAVIDGEEIALSVFRSLGGTQTELFESGSGVSKEIEIDNKRTILQSLKVSNSNQTFYDGKWEVNQEGNYRLIVNSSAPLIPGIYDVRMSFTDAVSNVAMNLTKQTPPEANFRWEPQEIMMGEEVTFRVTSMSGGIAPYRFIWDFGDGSIGEGQEIVHTYNMQGNYTVVLDTQDALGRNFRRVAQIEVEPRIIPRGPNEITMAKTGKSINLNTHVSASPLEEIALSSLQSEDGGITWRGQIEVKEGLKGRIYFAVSAIEQNQNPIEALTYRTPTYQTPKRQNNGAWTPLAMYGTDASHTVVVGEEILSNEELITNNGAINEPINHPTPVTNLQAQLQKGLKVELSWQASNETEVKYNIYTNNGNGEIDYVTKLAQTQSTSIELGSLTEAVYRFAVRVENNQGNEEKNENFIEMQIRYLGEASAKIVIPGSGKKINGNALMLVSENSSNTKEVQFYYRATNETNWHKIEKQEGINIAYWDATNFEQKQYELKAVAQDERGNPEENPESIMLIVDKTDPDIEENTIGEKTIKTQRMEQNTENTIELADGTGVTVPTNEDGSKIRIETLTSGEMAIKLPVEESSLKPAGIFRKFEFTDGKNQFSKELTISIPYLDQNNDGIIDGTNINTNDALIYYLKEETGEWIKVGKEGTNGFRSSLANFINLPHNKITAKTNHFTIFGIFKKAPALNLENVIVYPNPYKPSVSMQGGAGIKFDGLTASMRLRIYTISGKLVKEIETSTDGSYEWDTANNEGEKVASGVYIYIVTNRNEIKKGKLAIIK